MLISRNSLHASHIHTHTHTLSLTSQDRLKREEEQKSLEEEARVQAKKLEEEERLRILKEEEEMAREIEAAKIAQQKKLAELAKQKEEFRAAIALKPRYATLGSATTSGGKEGKRAEDLEKWLAAKHIEIDHDEDDDDDDAALADLLEATAGNADDRARGRMPSMLANKMKGPPAR